MTAYLLQHLLTESAGRHPDRIAVERGAASLSYMQLNRQSDGLAQLLRQEGITAGERVGILLPKSPDQVTALFGLLKAGVIYVPLDPAAPEARIDQVIRQCAITRLVTDDHHLERLRARPDSPVTTAFVACRGGAGAVPAGTAPRRVAYDPAAIPQTPSRAAELSDGSPAYILHTSGSTGIPKGVVISHRNALAFIETAAEHFRVTPHDRFASHAPLHFDLSVFDIFVAVRCGSTIVPVPERLSTFPVSLADFIAREKITVWNSVSSVLAMLADKGMPERHDFTDLRLIHFSGDVMPARSLRKLKRCMPSAEFYNIYGQTEANSSLCYRIGDIPDNDSWKIPLGRPMPNFEAFALDDSMQPVTGPGQVGELHVCSSTVALGYWNAPDSTRDKFVPDPRYPSLNRFVYKTGDLVSIDGNGDYEFRGRRDHMVKSRGYRIELAEIELALISHPGITAAAAIAIPDEITGNRIAAFAMPAAAGGTVSVAELAGHCLARLPRYMVPEIMIVRETLPMTSSGKIDRTRLADEASRTLSHYRECQVPSDVS